MAYLDNTGLAQVWFKVCARIDSKVEGAKGKSLYQSWLDTGHTGTEADFVKDMKGKPGDPGEPGEPGKSAYDLWKEQGNDGSMQDFLDSVKGKDGKSAYQLWLEEGHSGSKAEFLASLKGEKGDPMQVVARTVALDASGWSPDKRRTVTVEGVTASNHIIVSPAPESMEAAGKAGLYAVAQAAGSLTFACSKVPEGFVNINVLIL